MSAQACKHPIIMMIKKRTSYAARKHGTVDYPPHCRHILLGRSTGQMRQMIME